MIIWLINVRKQNYACWVSPNVDILISVTFPFDKLPLPTVEYLINDPVFLPINSYDECLLILVFSPPAFIFALRKPLTHWETFPIITTYPSKEKLKSLWGNFMKWFFHVFFFSWTPHIRVSKLNVFNYYVAGKVIASKHSYHSTALQLIRFASPPLFFQQKPKTLFDVKTFLWFELIFEDFPFGCYSFFLLFLVTFSYWIALRPVFLLSLSQETPLR